MKTLNDIKNYISSLFDIHNPRKRRILFLVAQCLTEFFLVWTVLKIYTYIRGRFGSAAVSPEVAYQNALTVISIEESLGLFFEQELQQVTLNFSETFMMFCNNYYSAMHFISVTGTLCCLFLSTHDLYPNVTKDHSEPASRDRRQYFYFWRNVLLVMTCTGLIGYATFPLMPPRLLTECESGYGACQPDYTFIDTLEVIGFGLGAAFGDNTAFINWKSKRMQKLGNYYAAMPSLHTAWSLWVCFSLRSIITHIYEPSYTVRSSSIARATVAWLKAFSIFHPIFTIFVIMATANHYWMDAMGGTVILIIAYSVARYLPDLSTLKLLKWVFGTREDPTLLIA